MAATALIKGLRPASKAMGDDVTLTRFVKVPTEKKRRVHHQPRIPGLQLAFVEEGRTKFPKRRQRIADRTVPLLVSGHSNVKIGRDVRKGYLKGYWIYTLTLEERATCPSSCLHWSDCYGNNMPYPARVDHTDPSFLPTLSDQIAKLVKVRGRTGVLIRLHALGDFYSVEYVRFWREQLMKHKTLALYGYTAREPTSDIGWAVRGLAADFKRRAMIRFSSATWPLMAAVPIQSEEDAPDNAFVCPEQTGRTRCCATCGACWSTAKNVAFVAH